MGVECELGLVSERLRDYGFVENDVTGGKLGGSPDEETGGFNLKSVGHLGKPQVMTMANSFFFPPVSMLCIEVFMAAHEWWFLFIKEFLFFGECYIEC